MRLLASAGGCQLSPQHEELRRFRGRAARVNGNGAGHHPVSDAPTKAKADLDWWRSKLIDVQELCDRAFAPLKYVVPGLFPEGVTLLASRPKMGKSWLLLQVTTAVAGGKSTLTAGDQPPPVGDVLYLALEDNPRRLQRRLWPRERVPGALTN